MTHPRERASTTPRGPQSGPNPSIKLGAPTYWPALGSKDDIPPWLRDNDYILTYHPFPTNSYATSFRLWRCLHMETLNIWTHLLGSLFFLSTAIVLAIWPDSINVPLFRNAQEVSDALPFAIYLPCAALCFALSALFHTLRSHSYPVHRLCGKLDVLGICVLALGTGCSATHFAFYCDDRLRRRYVGAISAAAVVAGTTLFDSGGGRSRMRRLRGGVFGGLAVMAVMPVVHGGMMLGWSQGVERIGLQWWPKGRVCW